MRFEGRLDKWDDTRGYGFITPARGGEPVFVHVSAFPRDGRRPQVGELLSFEVEPARDGRKQATRVLRALAQPLHRLQPSAPRPDAARSARDGRPRGGRRGSQLATAAVTVLVIGLGVAAYARFGARPAPASNAYPLTAPAAGARYRCDGRTRCSQMTSCDEAKYFLANCPGVKMDGDGDGVPCERQWCGR